MNDEKKIAEHGDTCSICGYVYEEFEEIHKHKSDSQKLALFFAAGIATASAMVASGLLFLICLGAASLLHSAENPYTQAAHEAATEKTDYDDSYSTKPVANDIAGRLSESLTEMSVELRHRMAERYSYRALAKFAIAELKGMNEDAAGKWCDEIVLKHRASIESEMFPKEIPGEESYK